MLFGMVFKPRAVFTLFAVLALIAVHKPASAIQIKRVVTDAGLVLKLRGDVRDGDYSRLKSILRSGSVVGVEIRSGGGSLADGAEIAQAVRDQALVVYAPKECDSVCAFIFFAAKDRYMGRRARIGVHSVSNQRGKEDADTAHSTIVMSRLLAGFGVPHSIIGKIVATPPAKVTFLNTRELAGLNVRRNNPFQSRGAASAAAQSEEICSSCAPALNLWTEAPARFEERPSVSSVPHGSVKP